LVRGDPDQFDEETDQVAEASELVRVITGVLRGTNWAVVLATLPSVVEMTATYPPPSEVWTASRESVGFVAPAMLVPLSCHWYV